MLRLKYFALHLHLELTTKTKEKKKKQHLRELQLRDSPGLWHKGISTCNNTIWKVKSPGQETNWTWWREVCKQAGSTEASF